MSYVFNNASNEQRVYVNGVLDGSRNTGGPYQGIQGDLTIGTNGVCAGANHWDGCLDQITYYSRAKRF